MKDGPNGPDGHNGHNAEGPASCRNANILRDISPVSAQSSVRSVRSVMSVDRWKAVSVRAWRQKLCFQKIFNGFLSQIRIVFSERHIILFVSVAFGFFMTVFKFAEPSQLIFFGLFWKTAVRKQ